jgi:hypothetical protein
MLKQMASSAPRLKRQQKIPCQRKRGGRRFSGEKSLQLAPISSARSSLGPSHEVDAPPSPRMLFSMSWQSPSFVEINMNAEIGGYNPDVDDREPTEPIFSGEAQQESNREALEG